MKVRFLICPDQEEALAEADLEEALAEADLAADTEADRILAVIITAEDRITIDITDMAEAVALADFWEC